MQRSLFLIFVIITLVFFTIFCAGTLYFKDRDFADLIERPLSSTAQIPNLIEIARIPQRVCDIRAYGATRDLSTKSTQAINAAIRDCSSQGGGVVYVPHGQWLSGAITLQSNINLYLAENAEIIFSTDLQDYLPVAFTRFQGMEFYNYAPLIYIKDGHDVAITGKGKLVGNGDDRAAWTGRNGDFEVARQKLLEMSLTDVPVEERIFGEKIPGLRPSFIQFVNCKNIVLDGITVENGPIWTIHPVYSENFTARNLTINTWSGNTDGIAIDSTKNVLIEKSFFSTGDDAISIKSGLDGEGQQINIPAENILIRNITVIKGSSGVSIGSEMSGGVRNVEVRDSVFQHTRHGFRIKSTKTRGGFIENVHVENVTMDHMTGDAIDINLAYSTEVRSDLVQKPRINDIVIKGIRGQDNERLGINMDGISNNDMSNIVIEDVKFGRTERGTSIKNVSHVTLKNISIDALQEPQYEIENSQNIVVQDATCGSINGLCMSIVGAKTRNIELINIDHGQTAQFVQFAEGASRSFVKIVE